MGRTITSRRLRFLRHVPRHSRPLIRRLAALGRRNLYGAEVGVFEGDNAQALLEWLPGLQLILVDPYKPMPPIAEWSWRDMGYRTEDDFNAALLTAKMRLDFAADRCEWRLTDSVTAAKDIPSESLDFAFIDALHDYEHVIADIWVWWPKIKPGCLLGGHDYGTLEGYGWGVKRAVDEFASTRGLVIEPDIGRTWWIKKA